MRAFVERVSEACVKVNDEIIGRIGPGLLVYLGVEKGDSDADVAYIVEKIRYLRIFEDDAGKMNLEVSQAGGQILAISAFTLQADARKGRRPSFDNAASPELANDLYLKVVAGLTAAGLTVQTGRFAAKMAVTAVNNGPICLPLDSRRLF